MRSIQLKPSKITKVTATYTLAVACGPLRSFNLADRCSAAFPQAVAHHEAHSARPTAVWITSLDDFCGAMTKALDEGMIHVILDQAAYDARVLDAVIQFGCPRFAAILAVHGQAVMAEEIAR